MTRTPEEVVASMPTTLGLPSFARAFAIACIKADREQREAVTDAEVEAAVAALRVHWGYAGTSWQYLTRKVLEAARKVRP